ncbi:MAG: hypothetical protein HYZ20_02515, partial [Burkholderiales bacterium]|nr:hypothetical protein [Burkholderiales bacterium]
ELALKRGGGRLAVHASGDGVPDGTVWKYSTGLHCPQSDIRYADPQPAVGHPHGAPSEDPRQRVHVGG